jgi:DNA-binding MarR family transcriptional regulator
MLNLPDHGPDQARARYVTDDRVMIVQNDHIDLTQTSVYYRTVAGKIQAEIRQTKPFRCIEEEAFLNIQRTADVMMQDLIQVLKPYGLSPTQYNVLRILRGAGDAGVTCKDIGSRMVTRDPDITRLLDRLERRHLITRSRAKEDRRFVSIQISEDGMEALRELDEPVTEMCLRVMQNLGSDRVQTLIELLEQTRERSS